MTVRRFKNTGWQADFYAGAERIRKVFPTKKEAKDYESKIKTEIRENRCWNIQREEFDTFSEMLDWYLELPQAKGKKSHQNDVRRAEYLRDFFGKLSPVRITPERVEEYIHKRLTTKNRRKRFNKPATVNRELSLFSRVFNLAYRNGKTHYIPRSQSRNSRARRAGTGFSRMRSGKRTTGRRRPGTSRSPFVHTSRQCARARS